MTQVRYVGDGEHYVPGRPAVEGAIEDVDDATATALIETGLYAPADVPKGKKAEKADKDADGAADGGDS